ncbi:MAG: CHAP domain-containing protein [Candidatus Paceibacterota bacterium]|jgi:hypothetical protein
MNRDEYKGVLNTLSEQQKELIDILKRNNGDKKDFWDKFSAASTFLSGVIVALVGLYFTNNYNVQQASRDESSKSQQLRLAQVELIHKFIPQLNGTEKEKKLAIIAISSLGNAELATKIAVLDQSNGAKSALESLAKSGNSEEKNLAQQALENFEQFKSHLSNVQGGGKIGRAVIEKVAQDLKSGVWEEGGSNKGELINKFLSNIGLPEGTPWSAAFVSWYFSQVKNPPPFKPSGSWAAIEAEFKQKGWLLENSDHSPQPGDIMFITNQKSHHGGIVLRYENGQVEVIEGNVSIGQGSEGKMAAVKIRQLQPNMSFGHVPD